MSTLTSSRHYSVAVNPRWLSAAVALAMGFAVWHLMSDRVSGDLRETAGTLAAVSVTLLGFLIAALTILTTLLDRRLVVNMRKTGHFQQLTSDIYWTAASYFAATVLAVATTFVVDGYVLSVLALSTGLAVYATGNFVTAGRRFLIFIEFIGRPPAH